MKSIKDFNKRIRLTSKPKWQVNTAALFKEIIENNPDSVGILRAPLNIFQAILVEIGEVAIDINDPRLNQLMCRLSIYSIADPYNPEYDEKIKRIVMSDQYLKNPKILDRFVAKRNKKLSTT